MAKLGLSVIMATYNGESWIGDQLRSIAAQSRPPDELIVSDDGSTDRTVEIVQHFSETAPFPVHLIKGPSKGHAENFWSASMACNADLISWSDQDDVWHPRKLEISESRLLASNAEVATHSATVTNSNLTPLGRCLPDYRSSVVLDCLEGDPWFVISGFSILLRREILTRIDWDNRPISHQSGVPMGPDHALSLVSFASAKRALISKSLAFYRQHADNLAGAREPYSLRDAMRVGLEDYRALAGYARSYFEFLARCGCSSRLVAEYFEALISRCDRRAEIYEQRGIAHRIGQLGRAVASGVYGPRDSGRFPPAELAKDVTDLFTNAAHRANSH